MRPGGDELGVCWGTCHVVWGLCYIAAGAVQLVAGLFALFSLPVLSLGSNVWTGAWNILAGISGALLAGLATELSATRQEVLLYLSLSVLGVNTANLVILEAGEWGLLLADATRQEIAQRGISRLVYYARISTSVSTALVLVTSLLDSHISFCVLQARDSRRRGRRAVESVSDIEYVIPRKKPSKIDEEEEENLTNRSSHNQNAQSWVFDTGPANSDPSCLQAALDNSSLDGGGSDSASETAAPNSYLLSHGSPPRIVVKVDTAPSVEDRTLNHMKSFSRTPSPTCSLSHPIYESVPDHDSPRSRLYTADYVYHQRYNAGEHRKTHRRCESVDNRPHSASSIHITTGVPEKIQYASLMLELEQAIQCKRPPIETSSPSSSSSSTDESPRKDSDSEFSKELEAALQLLHDLGSPTTIDTPSEPTSKPVVENATIVVVDDHDAGKTILPAGKSTFSSEEDCASSSGYSSPVPGGSMTLLCPPLIASSIRNEGAKAVVSLFPGDTVYQSNGVTTIEIKTPTPHICSQTWKKRVSINPEFANVIYETESLVYLSELELLARHCRTKAEQRQIELRAQQRIHASSAHNGRLGGHDPSSTMD